MISRNIKYRGWDERTQEMFIISRLIWDVRGNLIGGDDSWFGEDFFCPPLKSSKEVMQSTGLTDKNGTEIFEGDQFLIDENIYFVQFIDDRGSYVLTTGNGFDSNNCIEFNCDTIFNLEIIGNIHTTKLT